MLSRVAESLFWMSRYFERAENTARFLDVNFHLLLDLNKITAVDNPNYWVPLILVTSDEARFKQLYNEYTAETVTDYLVFNRNNSNSISSCISMARENARSVIESISSEMWEQINNLYHFLQAATPQQVRHDPYGFYKEIKNASHLFQGITDNTFSRNEGWDFVQVGKYLERADNTARLIDVKYHMLIPHNLTGYHSTNHHSTNNHSTNHHSTNHHSTNHHEGMNGSVDIIQWMAVLKSCSALEAFRKVYLSKIDPDNILRFLILDHDFPRSISFSVSAAEDALLRLSGSSRRAYMNNADRLIGKMEADLSYVTVEDIYSKGLHEYLEDMEQQLVKVGEQVHLIYFAYHTPEIEPQDVEEALPFTGVSGGRANWRQAQQQQ